MLMRSAATIVLLTLAASSLHGQSRSRYRDFELGSDVSSVSAHAKIAASEAKTIHSRPAVMQELEWRPPYVVTSLAAVQDDPVRQIVFSFYDNQLSRMVVDYEHERTSGLTDADMIDALSGSYGPPLKPAGQRPRASLSRVEEESGTPLARWGDPDYSLVLYRSSYGSGFRVIVTSPKLEALARTAEARAILLDDREAPQRDLARLKKEAEDTRAAEEKARIANKATFRP
jgi:hypothetical protein